MRLTSKLDLASPSVVRAVRAFYLAYMLGMQGFGYYAERRAREEAVEAVVVEENPLGGLLARAGGSGGNGVGPSVVAGLGSTLLKGKRSPRWEYDVAQAVSLRKSQLFPLLLASFFHFKLGHVQPLVFQAASGWVSFWYNPLFRAYAPGGWWGEVSRPFGGEGGGEGGESLADGIVKRGGLKLDNKDDNNGDSNGYDCDD